MFRYIWLWSNWFYGRIMLTSLGGDLKLRSTEDFDGRKSVGIDSPIEHHLAIPGFELRPSFKRGGRFSLALGRGGGAVGGGIRGFVYPRRRPTTLAAAWRRGEPYARLRRRGESRRLRVCAPGVPGAADGGANSITRSGLRICAMFESLGFEKRSGAVMTSRRGIEERSGCD